MNSVAMKYTKRLAVALILSVCISHGLAKKEIDSVRGTGVKNFDNTFIEELYMRPLPSGHVYSHFEFTTVWKNKDIIHSIRNYDDFEFVHFDLFPRALGEIIEQYHVRELHLSLTQGLWRHKKWGYPVTDAPPGAELWVWFNPRTKNLDQAWKDLVNALSGLFCASLNFIDSTNTVSPELSYRPLGLAENWYWSNSSYLRYAALPRENVCTENLTPWKKLLPCDTKSGMSTLLHPSSVYSSHYHSLALHLRPACKTPQCSEPVIELLQSLSVVQSTLQHMDGHQDWTLRKLFTSPLISVCPLATKSLVYIDVTDNENMEVFYLKPEPQKIQSQLVNGITRSLAVYDALAMVTEEQFNLEARYSKRHIFGHIPPSPLHASRFLTGYGQESGSITVVLTNTLQEPLKVVYLEVLPWYLRLYFHTTHTPQTMKSLHISKLVTAKDRERGWLYEAVVTVPGRSSIELRLEFTRALLKWLEYPPDANHGFYLPAATLSFILPNSKNVSATNIHGTTLSQKLKLVNATAFVRIHTETLLVSLPTPDFSMPYNVICLACTVVALAFGPIHNITTKKLTLKKVEEKKEDGRNLVRKIKDFFTSFSRNSVVIKADKEPVVVEENPLYEEKESEEDIPEANKDSEEDIPEASRDSESDETCRKRL